MSFMRRGKNKRKGLDFMKCSLCGSTVEQGVCTFCGMASAQEEHNEPEYDKDILQGLKETTGKIQTAKRLPAVYEEHYERRHIHGENGASVKVSSLMVKLVLLIILTILAYMVILSGPEKKRPEGDMPEIRQEDTFLAAGER